MTEFRHTDSDGDSISVVLQADVPDHLRYVATIRGGEDRGVRQAYLSEGAAAQLALVLGGKTSTEPLQQVAESASIDWAIGEHTIRIEGRTAAEVAAALRVALGPDIGDTDEAELRAYLAELLDCDGSSVEGEVEQNVRRRAELVDEVEALTMQLDKRTAQLRQEAAIAKRVPQLEQANEALRASVNGDLAGVRDLRRELLHVGLNGMSNAPLSEIAAAIAKLGRENNALREQVNGPGKKGDELQRQVRELQEELAALDLVGGQLQRAAEHERSLRRAAEQARDEWIERHRHECVRAERAERAAAALRDEGKSWAARVEQLQTEIMQQQAALAEQRETISALRGEVDSKARQLRQDADAFEEWQRMRDAAREALIELRGEFLNADTGEVEAADLSSEQASLLVAKINRALDESA